MPNLQRPYWNLLLGALFFFTQSAQGDLKGAYQAIKLKNPSEALQQLEDVGSPSLESIDQPFSDQQASGTLLYHAAQKGYSQVVEQLIKMGAQPNTLNGKYLSTPLQTAAARNHLKTVRVLLKNGAAVGIKNNIGNTILHTLAKDGNKSLIQELLPYTHPEDLALEDEKGRTAAKLAELAKHASLSQLLLNTALPKPEVQSAIHCEDKNPVGDFSQASNVLPQLERNILQKEVTLVVKLSVTAKKEEERINEQTVGAGLLPHRSYHCTLGIIPHVPKDQAEKLRTKLYQLLNSSHPLINKPIPFAVKEATTFGKLGKDIYSSRHVILVPKDPETFQNLNKKISENLEKLLTLSKPITLNGPTSPEKYTAHITLNTPQLKDSANLPNSEIIEPAISALNKELNKPNHFEVIYLDDYRISIQE